MTKDKAKKWQAQVVRYQSDEVEHTIPCNTQAGAERVVRGLDINLNHKLFYTRAVKA